MANQAAKKRKIENAKHIQLLQYLILGSNVFYVFVRMIIFYSSFTWKHWLGLIVTSGAYKLSYDQLARMAKPSYDDDGELLDGGYNMSEGGICGYIHDIIYITIFVQLSSIISGKFWYIYLVIPIFALYKLWKMVLQPFFFQSSSDEVEDDKSRRKREKMERKASRPKFMKTRTK